MIAVIDFIYVTIIYKENIAKRTFASLGVKIKYVVQELSILTFLVVLSIFAVIDTDGFKKSTIYAVLEIVVVVAVFLSIAAELFSVVWLVMELVKNFLKDRRLKKKQQKEFIFEKAELLARDQIQDEPVIKAVTIRPMALIKDSNQEMDEFCENNIPIAFSKSGILNNNRRDTSSQMKFKEVDQVDKDK